MRIEDYWFDTTIYEVEYKISPKSKEKVFYGYVFCESSTSKKDIGEKIEEKIKKDHKNSVCVTINEIYSAFVDKNIDSEIKVFSFYQARFKVNHLNKERFIEKVIIEEAASNYDKISTKIKKKFSNVVDVITIKELCQVVKAV